MILEEGAPLYNNLRLWEIEASSLQLFAKQEFKRGPSASLFGRFNYENVGRVDPKNGKGAKDNPKENASGQETYVRLSHFKDDKRVDFENNCLKPGTFTTTEKDYRTCVQQSDVPIDRYALPSDDPIYWAFFVEPKKDDELQSGIVQPAFGRNGGGIEAYFEDGTSARTFKERRLYGK
jgi:hypothetical protein